jgi:cytochrome bd ubiquinol oxidase subunit II
MNLNILWFVLVGVLYAGFFFLEGFDFGVGMLLPFLGKKDIERRAVINTIGPHWDGNEVWLITAIGATFAAFPNWYATMLSGFYATIFLLLLALIVRGVGFEFRSKVASPIWRYGWDTAIAAGSFLASFLLGMIFTNIVTGVPIDGNQLYTCTFFTLFNPMSILGGMAFVSIFLAHGANYLGLRLMDELHDRVGKVARPLWIAAFLLMGAYFTFMIQGTPGFMEKGFVGFIFPLLTVLSWILSRIFIGAKKEGWAFATTGLAIIFMVAGLFTALFPRVLVSSLAADFSLTIYNASSSPYTLKVMSIVAAILVPVVLAYQVWTYWVFRKRVKADKDSLTY